MKSSEYSDPKIDELYTKLKELLPHSEFLDDGLGQLVIYTGMEFAEFNKPSKPKEETDD